MKIHCWLWGCWSSYGPWCDRCGAHAYDDDYIQVGRLQRLATAWDRFKEAAVRLTIGHHCEVCGKRLKRGEMFICDNKDCRDSWMPF